MSTEIKGWDWAEISEIFGLTYDNDNQDEMVVKTKEQLGCLAARISLCRIKGDSIQTDDWLLLDATREFLRKLEKHEPHDAKILDAIYDADDLVMLKWVRECLTLLWS